MGVYIKGMEMPIACVYRKNGHLITCPLYDIDGYCGALNTEAIHKENGKLSDCPLVPVPPHGDLIDKDATMNAILEERGEDTACWFAGIVNDMPAIVPSDKVEEGEI